MSLSFLHFNIIFIRVYIEFSLVSFIHIEKGHFSLTVYSVIELFSPDHNGKSFKKKLPSSMQVHRLSGLVQKLFDTGNTIPKLACISSKVLYYYC